MIYVLLANGFEEIEALTPVDVLRRAGLEVKTVSIQDTELVTGSHGIPVKADTMIDKVLDTSFDMLVLPGGLPGADNLQSSPAVRQLIDFAVNNGKYLAAICAAPKILGAVGLLDGKNATSFPGYEAELKGATYSTARVVVDGNIITSRGAGTSMDFALQLVAILQDTKTAEELRNKMLV